MPTAADMTPTKTDVTSTLEVCFSLSVDHHRAQNNKVTGQCLIGFITALSVCYTGKGSQLIITG